MIRHVPCFCVVEAAINKFGNYSSGNRNLDSQVLSNYLQLSTSYSLFTSDEVINLQLLIFVKTLLGIFRSCSAETELRSVKTGLGKIGKQSASLKTDLNYLCRLNLCISHSNKLDLLLIMPD